MHCSVFLVVARVEDLIVKSMITPVRLVLKAQGVRSDQLVLKVRIIHLILRTYLIYT